MSTEQATRELNPRQKQFARLYVDLGNASQAYREAGYSEKDANVGSSRLLATDSIQVEVTRLKNVTVRSTASIRSHVLNGLWDISETGKSETNRVRSYELLGKTARMFVDVKETTGANGAVVPELKTYTLEELVKIRQALFDGVDAKALSGPVEDTGENVEGDDANQATSDDT